MHSATTVSTILDAVTTFVTSAISWITSFTSTIVSNPLLLVFVITAFVGMAVGLIKRIIKL